MGGEIVLSSLTGMEEGVRNQSIVVQFVVHRLPALIRIGLPSEMLLCFQEHYKKPDPSCGLIQFVLSEL